jgi:hypothetical protein
VSPRSTVHTSMRASRALPSHHQPVNGPESPTAMALVNRKKRRDFTEEEDAIIVRCHKKFGCRWAKMRCVRVYCSVWVCVYVFCYWYRHLCV